MFKKDKNLPWQAYVLIGEEWKLHSSYTSRGLAENCLKTVKQYQPNIQMKVMQKIV